MKKKQRQHFELSLKVGGKLVTGSYFVESKTVTAFYGDSQQTTHVGSGAEAEMTARMLIREMVDIEEKRGG